MVRRDREGRRLGRLGFFFIGLLVIWSFFLGKKGYGERCLIGFFVLVWVEYFVWIVIGNLYIEIEIEMYCYCFRFIGGKIMSLSFSK